MILKKEEGFTLVEIMIVIAIIGLLASMALPNLMRMRTMANEGSVKSELKGFSSASEIFRAAQNPFRYADSLAEMVNDTPSYIDSTWLVNPRRQHVFTYAVGALGDTYSMLAVPNAGGGFNTYCIDQSGILVSSVNGVGAPTSAASGCVGGTPLQV